MVVSQGPLKNHLLWSLIIENQGELYVDGNTHVQKRTIFAFRYQFRSLFYHFHVLQESSKLHLHKFCLLKNAFASAYSLAWWQILHKWFETFKLSTTFLAEVVTLKIPKPEMVVSFFQFFGNVTPSWRLEIIQWFGDAWWSIVSHFYCSLVISNLCLEIRSLSFKISRHMINIASGHVPHFLPVNLCRITTKFTGDFWTMWLSGKRWRKRANYQWV